MTGLYAHSDSLRGILGPNQRAHERLRLLRPADLELVVDNEMRHPPNPSRVRLLYLTIDLVTSLPIIKPILGLAPLNTSLHRSVQQIPPIIDVPALLEVARHHGPHQILLRLAPLFPVLLPRKLHQPVRIPRIPHLALERKANPLALTHRRHVVVDGLQARGANPLYHALHNRDAAFGGQRRVQVVGLPGDVEGVGGAVGDRLFVEVDGAVEALFAEVAVGADGVRDDVDVEGGHGGGVSLE